MENQLVTTTSSGVPRSVPSTSVSQRPACGPSVLLEMPRRQRGHSERQLVRKAARDLLRRKSIPGSERGYFTTPSTQPEAERSSSPSRAPTPPRASTPPRESPPVHQVPRTPGKGIVFGRTSLTDKQLSEAKVREIAAKLRHTTKPRTAGHLRPLERKRVRPVALVQIPLDKLPASRQHSAH